MEYEEDQEEEEQENEISLNPSYDGGSARPPPPKLTSPSATPPPPLLPPRKSRYRECLKNHAVTIGGHATDGCGEFIAAGDDGTLDSLKCAACNCHRNFHRKDAAAFFPFPHPQQQMLLYHRTAPRAALLALPSSSGGGGSREEAEEYNYYSTPGSQKKRFRTKFSGEQKEKMLDLAERLGWKIQKQDEELVQHFCYEMGIKRHVLKVWMHNNKHTLGKKT